MLSHSSCYCLNAGLNNNTRRALPHLGQASLYEASLYSSPLIYSCQPCLSQAPSLWTFSAENLLHATILNPKHSAVIFCYYTTCFDIIQSVLSQKDCSSLIRHGRMCLMSLNKNIHLYLLKWLMSFSKNEQGLKVVLFLSHAIVTSLMAPLISVRH